MANSLPRPSPQFPNRRPHRVAAHRRRKHPPPRPARRHGIEFRKGCRDGWPFAKPCMPLRQRTSGYWAKPIIHGAVDHRGGCRVGPTERRTAKPRRCTQAIAEPGLQNARLPGRFRFHLFGEVPTGSLEPEDFAKTPIHRLIVRIAHVLGDAGKYPGRECRRRAKFRPSTSTEWPATSWGVSRSMPATCLFALPTRPLLHAINVVDGKSHPGMIGKGRPGRPFSILNLRRS
jgi:hypothetical protein